MNVSCWYGECMAGTLDCEFKFQNQSVDIFRAGIATCSMIGCELICQRIHPTLSFVEEWRVLVIRM